MILEFLLCAVFLIVYFVMKNRKPSNLPPGPSGIPFIGSLPVFEEQQLENLQKKYGNIVYMRCGGIPSVILFDYKVGKEVMARQEFAWRPSVFSEISLDEQKIGGLTSSVGLQWQHDRRFALRNLRDLGMGKSYLDEAVNIEAKALVEDLRKYKGELTNFPGSFKAAAVNVIWQMVAGTRYDLRSDKIKLIHRLSEEYHEASKYALLPICMPVLKYLPQPVRNFLFKEHRVNEYLRGTTDLLNQSIDEHEKKFDPNNPRDLIDEYLKGMKQESDDSNTLFRKGALRQIINDLFTAGSDTISYSLRWVVYLLARHPNIAAKLQKEIDSVVPRTKMVSVEDKPNLSYVEAFIVECLRYSSLLITNVHRSSIQNTTIEGYHIPKNTMVTVCSYSVHRDPTYWTEPEKFSPERFIDDGGKFKAPHDGFFAFGSGRRQCLGEPLARMELFLFSAAIIQNFNIRVPDGVQFEEGAETKMMFRIPIDNKLIYEHRH